MRMRGRASQTGALVQEDMKVSYGGGHWSGRRLSGHRNEGVMLSHIMYKHCTLLDALLYYDIFPSNFNSPMYAMHC